MFDTSNMCNRTMQNEINYEKYIEEPWSIIESYFSGKHLQQLVRHQIESYNNFITYQISRTINMFNPVAVHSEHDYVQKCNKYKLHIQKQCRAKTKQGTRCTCHVKNDEIVCKIHIGTAGVICTAVGPLRLVCSNLRTQ